MTACPLPGKAPHQRARPHPLLRHWLLDHCQAHPYALSLYAPLSLHYIGPRSPQAPSSQLLAAAAGIQALAQPQHLLLLLLLHALPAMVHGGMVHGGMGRRAPRQEQAPPQHLALASLPWMPCAQPPLLAPHGRRVRQAWGRWTREGLGLGGRGRALHRWPELQPRLLCSVRLWPWRLDAPVAARPAQVLVGMRAGHGRARYPLHQQQRRQLQQRSAARLKGAEQRWLRR